MGRKHTSALEMSHWYTRNFKSYQSDAVHTGPDWRTTESGCAIRHTNKPAWSLKKIRWGENLRNNSLFGRAKAGCGRDWRGCRKQFSLAYSQCRETGVLTGVGRGPRVWAAPPSREMAVERVRTQHLKHNYSLGQVCWGVRRQYSGSIRNGALVYFFPQETFKNIF